MNQNITITNGIDLVIRKLHYALEDNAIEEFKKSSVRRWVTYRQYLYLKAIYLEPNISQNELSLSLHNNAVAISRMTMKLKSKGYISIVEGEDNRNKRIINLTASGRKVVLTGFKVIKRGLVKNLGNISTNEYNAVTKILATILKDFEK